MLAFAFDEEGVEEEEEAALANDDDDDDDDEASPVAMGKQRALPEAAAVATTSLTS